MRSRFVVPATSHLPGRLDLLRRGGSAGSCSTVRASPIVNATPREQDPLPPRVWFREGGGGSADLAKVSTSLLQPHPFTAQLPY